MVKKAATKMAATKRVTVVKATNPAISPGMRDVILQAIEDSGKSVRAVAITAGIAQPMLSRFVRGDRDLLLDSADKVAKALGLELRKIDT